MAIDCPSIIDPCQKPPSPVAISAEAMRRHDHASRLRLWLARDRGMGVSSSWETGYGTLVSQNTAVMIAANIIALVG